MEIYPSKDRESICCCSDSNNCRYICGSAAI